MDTKLYYIPNIQNIVYEGDYELKLENLPMNRFDTVLYKGSTNTIDFSVRDKDRKPINLLDKTLVVYISETQSKELKIQRELEVLDAYKGFARLTLIDADTTDWDPAFYRYAVVVTEENGREGFSYVDQTYKVTGTFELKDDALPISVDSTEVTTFLSDNNTFDSDPNWFSSAVVYGPGTVHSAVFYLTDFIGDISVEATLDETPTTNHDDWSTIATLSFNTETSDIQYFNITGNYNWVRFGYNPHEFNEGTIDKVVYR